MLAHGSDCQQASFDPSWLRSRSPSSCKLAERPHDADAYPARSSVSSLVRTGDAADASCPSCRGCGSPVCSGRYAVRSGDSGGREAVQSSIRRHVGRNVRELLTADEIRGHVPLQEVRILSTRIGGVLPRGADLARDDVFDRAVLVALCARLGEGSVEIRPDRSTRSRGGERMTTRALRDEELPAGDLLSADHIADSIVWALTQPQGVDINTMVIRPIGQPV